MIRVNVFPKELKPSLALWMASVPWKRVASSLLAVAGFSSGGLWISNQLIERSLNRLSGQWDGVQAERQHLEELESSLRALQNRAAALKALKSEEAQWAPRLNLLTDALVPHLWFTSLKFEISLPEEEESKKSGSLKKGSVGGKASQRPAQEPPHLLLKGTYLVSTQGEGAPVRRFLNRLKEQSGFDRWFRAVELKSVEHRQIQQEEVSDFVIALYPTGL